MENPIRMDDLGVPLFSETALCSFIHRFINFLNRITGKGTVPWPASLEHGGHCDTRGFDRPSSLSRFGSVGKLYTVHSTQKVSGF